MKVIMLKDVRSVGQRGTLVEVSDGYASNFLIAKGLAEQATPEKIAQHMARTKAEEQVSAEHDKELAAAVRKLEGANVVVAARANEHGHLYHQLPTELIAKGIKEEYGVDVPVGAIGLEHPVKELGEREIEVHLNSHLATIKLSVVRADI